MKTVSIQKSTHAPLLERYMGDGFEQPGESGEYGRVDPETGAEYRALGGSDHRYNKDYKVGSSYPETLFFYAKDGEGDALDHDAVEEALRELDMWRDDRLHRVMLPKGLEYGDVTWWYAFQFRPPGMAPSTERLARRAEDAVGDDNVWCSPGGVEVIIDDG